MRGYWCEMIIHDDKVDMFHLHFLIFKVICLGKYVVEDWNWCTDLQVKEAVTQDSVLNDDD